MKPTLRNTALAVGFTALAAPAAAETWGNIQPAYNADGFATVRVEGGRDLGKWKLYGFADVDGSADDPVDVGSVYGEVRLRRPLKWNLSGLIEYNGGTGDDDLIRLGAQWDPKLGKKNTASLRGTWSPDGVQLAGYFRRKAGRLSGSVLVEHNFGPEKTYGELEIGLDLTKSFGLFAQGRALNKKEEGFSLTPVVGGRYTF